MRRKRGRGRHLCLPNRRTECPCSSELLGIARATTKIGMVNLVYNTIRLLFLRRTAATSGSCFPKTACAEGIELTAPQNL